MALELILTTDPVEVPSDTRWVLEGAPWFSPGKSRPLPYWVVLTNFVETEGFPLDVAAFYVPIFGTPPIGTVVPIRMWACSVVTGQRTLALEASDIMSI